MRSLNLGSRRTAFAAILMIATQLSLVGCVRSNPAISSDFHEPPSATDLKLIDDRPAEDKTSETLSYLVTSCDYAIYRVGDEMTIPSKLVLLKRDLKEAANGQLVGQTVTLNRYRIFLNSGAALRKVTFSQGGGDPGLIPSLLSRMGSNCSKEETKGGWYAASEVSTTNSPFIVEIKVLIGGKLYSSRTVYSPKTEVNYFHLGDPEQAHEVFAAIHQADMDLIAQINNH